MPPQADPNADVRPALRWKHVYAFLLGVWVYFSLAIIGMWLAMTGALVLQELGLIRRWGRGFGLGLDFLLFGGGVVLLAAWTLLMWRLRRMIVFTAKMCWYVPKAFLLYSGGGVTTVEAALTLAVSVGVWAGLIFGFGSFVHWPQPWWLNVIELVAVAAFGVAAVMAASLVSKASMKLLGVKDWRASLARSLDKVEMLPRPPSDSPPPARSSPPESPA